MNHPPAMTWMLPVGGAFLLLAAYAITLALQNRHRGSRDPPVVWSWLPYLGSIIPFGSDAVGFIQRCRRRHGDAFTILLAGNRTTFVLDQEATGKILKDSARLSFGPIADEVTRTTFGVPSESSRLVAEHAYADLHRVYVAQLQRQESLDELTRRALVVLDRQLNDAEVLGSARRDHSGEHWIERPMYKLVGEALFFASIEAMFGETLATRKTLEDFLAFDQGFPLLTAGLHASGAVKARNAIAAFFRTAEYEKEPSVSDFIRKRAEIFNRLQEKHGLPQAAHGSNQVAVLWASVSNTMPAAFWALYFCVRDPAAQRAVVEELKTKGVGTGARMPTGAQVDELKSLDSILTETLRMTTGSITMRQVVSPRGPHEILLPSSGRKVTVRHGDRVAIFPPGYHFDPEIFEDPDSFRWDRFMGEEGERLARMVIPFGGGITMCPGRFFARREIKAYVAAALMKYEWRLVDPAVPPFDRSRSGIGVYPPGKDVPVLVRSRESL